MRFFLQFANTAGTSFNHDNTEFETLSELMAYVNERYPDWTSYGITVLKVNPPQA